MSVYKDKAEETLTKLHNNPEWIDRFEGYAKEINKNSSNLSEKKKEFHKWAPLYLYLTTSEMKKSGSICFSLRYRGQEVGTLKVKTVKSADEANKDNTEILLCPAYENNKKNFGYCPDFQGEFPWNSDQARDFRKYFLQNPPRLDCGKKNEEHRLESLLLTYFEDNNKTIEEFKQIRPVSMIPGVRFPMPTPLSASNKKTVEYSGESGGGIDLFTRTGIGRGAHLNIMELKDENHKGEEPTIVIRQAIAYATFLLRLLRSESGEDWYKLFGFTSALPKSVKVYATCVMPKGYCEDKSFARQQIFVDQMKAVAYDAPTDGTDVIELHYLYFEETNDGIGSVDTSL